MNDILDGKKWRKFQSYNSCREVLTKAIVPKHPNADIFWNCFYSASSDGRWLDSTCFDLHSRLSDKYEAKYQVIHHVLPWRCDNEQKGAPSWTYCVRSKEGKLTIVTKHEIGKCPCCIYR